MASQHIKPRASDVNSTSELSDLAAAVANAVLSAKLRLDESAAAIANGYKASPVLSALSPPAFAIGEARVAIKFAIAQVGRSASVQRRGKRSPMHVHVFVSAASLAKIAPHLISEIEFRITPETKRAQPVQQDSDDPK